MIEVVRRRREIEKGLSRMGRKANAIARFAHFADQRSLL
jgi:hypothetical protein